MSNTLSLHDALPISSVKLVSVIAIAGLSLLGLSACKDEPNATATSDKSKASGGTSAGVVAQGPANPALTDPSKATEQAPATFKAKFTTSKGDFVVQVTRDWAPLGADRFYNLVKIGYFTDVRFFRAIQGFMVQFGIHGDPKVNTQWREARINDEPVKQSNKKGFVTFAKGGPNSRTTQMFINFGDNANLDAMGFPPFGEITEGMNVVDSLYTGYGEGAPQGRGPAQERAQREGNAYMTRDFPQLDYIKQAQIL